MQQIIWRQFNTIFRCWSNMLTFEEQFLNLCNKCFIGHFLYYFERYNHILLHMKIRASVTKNSDQDRGRYYLHLPMFFLYIHSPLLIKVVVIAVFLSFPQHIDHRPLFSYSIYIYIYIYISTYIYIYMMYI